MDYCKQIARIISRSLLCQLRSIRPHSYYTKLFTFVGKAISRRKYIRLLKRFIAIVFYAYRLPADIRQRRAGIYFKKLQLYLISVLQNYKIWTQYDILTDGFWQSIKLSDGVGVESNWDEESADKKEYRKDDINSNNKSSIIGSDNSEADSIDNKKEKSKGEDYNKNEDQNRKINIIGDLDGEIPLLIEEVLELLFGLIIIFNTEEVIDSRPASILLVYFSGVLRFSADLTSFLPARLYISNLAVLIYI